MAPSLKGTLRALRTTETRLDSFQDNYLQTRACWFQKHTCGTFTQSGSKPRGLGGRELEMKEVGLTAGCAHKPPLPSKPKARPCDRNQHESIKMKEQGEEGARQQWAGGHHRQKRENDCQQWKAAQKQNKTELNKIKTLSVSKPSHLFLFSFSFSSSFSAWQANGIGSLIRMEKIIMVSYICTLQTEAGGLQCLC